MCSLVVASSLDRELAPPLGNADALVDLVLGGGLQRRAEATASQFTVA